MTSLHPAMNAIHEKRDLAEAVVHVVTTVSIFHLLLSCGLDVKAFAF